MSENIDDVTGCVHGLVSGCRDCMIDRLTRERDEAVAMQAEERDWAAKWKARATAAEAKVKVLAASATDETEARHALRARIVALEAQLATRGACECGYDEVCALARRAQEAERERDEAQRKVAALTEGLRLVSDALARLDNIYREDTDLGDPPVETPAWLQEAQHRAATLLTPTAPAAGAGLCSARVNSAGNLCLMPAGHAGDHYPPTERAPQVIVRTDGTGSNPTPAPEEP